MKKSSNVPQENNMFQELKIFENNEINKALDSVYGLIHSNFNQIKDIMVCGSVARMFDGKLPEDYRPKDIDLLITDRFVFRFLWVNIGKLNAKVKFLDNRIVLYFNSCCVEIWLNGVVESQYRFGVFKNKINYCYL